MTDREKAIVMAYTGYCMLAGDKLKVFYEYVGELLGRPVYTHELADPDIQEKASNDFYKLCKETTPEVQKEMEYWHKLAQSYEHTICTLAQAIAEHGEKRWIPCSERLPEKDGRYWISTKTIACEDNFENGEFVFYRSNVLAWMPFPEPWRGGTDD